MKYKGILAVVGSAFALLAVSGSPVVTGERLASVALADSSKARPAKSRYSRYRAVKRGVRVRGFLMRGGYYSYVDPDVINTYGGTGTRYKSTGTFRDPRAEIQSQGGPFDSGFFFDSGIGPPWNDSPYPR